MATLQVRVTRICLPSMKSNVTNNKNELYGETVRLLSFKKHYCNLFQSSSILNSWLIVFAVFFAPSLNVWSSCVCVTEFGGSSHCLIFDKFRDSSPLIHWLTFYLILFRTCRGRAGKLLFKNCKDFYLAVLVRSCSCLCRWNFSLCLPKTPGRFKKAILLSSEDWSVISKQPNALPGENGNALREEHKKMTTFSSKLFACFL